MCHPAKAGIQPWGHDEATTYAEKPPKAVQSKPCSVVEFWMLAFANRVREHDKRS